MNIHITHAITKRKNEYYRPESFMNVYVQILMKILSNKI